MTLFKKSGQCVLHLDIGSELGLSADLFSNLLTALDCFSLEALGLELCEISTQNRRVFLSRTNGIIIAVVTEESASGYLELKSRMFSLMEGIHKLLAPIGGLSDSWVRLNSEVLGWLHEKIVELTQTARSAWNPLTPDEQFPFDTVGIRILTFLADQAKHTRYELGKQFGFPRSQIENTLSALEQEGFTTVEMIRTGRRTVRKYAISELGKLTLDALETFPGLWFQNSTTPS